MIDGDEQQQARDKQAEDECFSASLSKDFDVVEEHMVEPHAIKRIAHAWFAAIMLEEPGGLPDPQGQDEFAILECFGGDPEEFVSGCGPDGTWGDLPLLPDSLSACIDFVGTSHAAKCHAKGRGVGSCDKMFGCFDALAVPNDGVVGESGSPGFVGDRRFLPFAVVPLGRGPTEIIPCFDAPGPVEGCHFEQSRELEGFGL